MGFFKKWHDTKIGQTETPWGEAIEYWNPEEALALYEWLERD